MSTSKTPRLGSSAKGTAGQLRSIVNAYLPAWKRACVASDTHAIVLHAAAFGTSRHELLLFACAIKYAAMRGKNVQIASGEESARMTSHNAAPPEQIAKTYRERSPVKAGARRHAQRRTPPAAT